MSVEIHIKSGSVIIEIDEKDKGKSKINLSTRIAAELVCALNKKLGIDLFSSEKTHQCNSLV